MKDREQIMHELDEEYDTNRHLADRHGPNPAPKHGACPLCGAELDKDGWCYMCISMTGKLIGENHD